MLEELFTIRGWVDQYELGTVQLGAVLARPIGERPWEDRLAEHLLPYVGEEVVVTVSRVKREVS